MTFHLKLQFRLTCIWYCKRIPFSHYTMHEVCGLKVFHFTWISCRLGCIVTANIWQNYRILQWTKLHGGLGSDNFQFYKYNCTSDHNRILLQPFLWTCMWFKESFSRDLTVTSWLVESWPHDVPANVWPNNSAIFLLYSRSIVSFPLEKIWNQANQCLALLLCDYRQRSMNISKNKVESGKKQFLIFCCANFSSQSPYLRLGPLIFYLEFKIYSRLLLFLKPFTIVPSEPTIPWHSDIGSYTEVSWVVVAFRE